MGGGVAEEIRMDKKKKIVIAVGPEGGWSDDELVELQERGFVKVHMLGERVLRTDIAVRSHSYMWQGAADS
jgi:RsmE family RNA methyltransferase